MMKFRQPFHVAYFQWLIAYNHQTEAKYIMVGPPCWLCSSHTTKITSIFFRHIFSQKYPLSTLSKANILPSQKFASSSRNYYYTKN